MKLKELSKRYIQTEKQCFELLEKATISYPVTMASLISGCLAITEFNQDKKHCLITHLKMIGEMSSRGVAASTAGEMLRDILTRQAMLTTIKSLKLLGWNDNKDFPDELSEAQNGFSVDVLVYFPCLDEHTVAWYDFGQFEWQFLRKQDYTGRNFKWRYFINEIDKINFKPLKK